MEKKELYVAEKPVLTDKDRVTLQEKGKKIKLLDDLFFNIVYQDRDAAEELIRVIFDDDTLTVTNVVAQDSIPNLYGRSVRIDVSCSMEDGSERIVEVHRRNDEDYMRRMRYDSACVTAFYTPKSTEFKDVVDVYAVYISEFDPFKMERTKYEVDSVVRDSEMVLDDGFYRVLVNTEINDGTKLSRLLQHFKDPGFEEDSEFPCTSNMVKYFKATKKGADKMNASQEIFDLGFVRGNEQGKDAQINATVDRMISSGRFTDDDIIFSNNVTQEFVDERRAALKGKKLTTV